MTWMMTIAAGAALGYFLVQYLSRNNRAEQEDRYPESGNAETAEAQPVTAGRLHKSGTDKKIAGVCGGIAEYLRVDSSVVRLVTVLLVLGWGSGLLAYLICALVLPEE